MSVHFSRDGVALLDKHLGHFSFRLWSLEANRIPPMETHYFYDWFWLSLVTVTR